MPSPPFQILEATVAQLRSALDNEQVTSLELVQFYLARIKAHNLEGSALHAVIETNPDAEALAVAADAERPTYREKYGRDVPMLHGIPVMLKDNMATKDKMQITAGSWLLDGSIVPRDAGVVSRLREAGAVILGKANMTEWANWCAGGVMPDGWSGRGGQTKNPFGGTTSGSSSGSAVCATANFAAVTLGTETDGSIVSPSCLMSVVGLKPTVGLTSRSGVIPISGSQDSVGPITRCVEDTAALLDVICGVDEFDLKTRDADGKRPGVSYTAFLKSGGGALDGIQIGFDASMAGEACFASVDVFKKLGATVVDVVFPDVDQGTTRTVFSYEFKAGIKDYLGQLENCPYKTLEDLVVANTKNSREGNWGTHDWDCTVGDLDDPVYQNAINLQLKSSRENGLDKFFKENQLDAFVGKPTDFDNVCLDMAHAAAMSGYPVMTVPAPGDKTIPSAIGLIGLAWSEPTLLQIGYAYEQETHGRVVPVLSEGPCSK